MYIQGTESPTSCVHEEFPAPADPRREIAPNGAAHPQQGKPSVESIMEYMEQLLNLILIFVSDLIMIIFLKYYVLQS